MRGESTLFAAYLATQLQATLFTVNVRFVVFVCLFCWFVCFVVVVAAVIVVVVACA